MCLISARDFCLSFLLPRLLLFLGCPELTILGQSLDVTVGKVALTRLIQTHSSSPSLPSPAPPLMNLSKQGVQFHLRLFSTALPSASSPTHFPHKFSSSTHQKLHRFLEQCPSMNQLKQIHAQIMFHDLSSEILTLGKLISFCAVADEGDLIYAHHVFDRMPQPNKLMYNSLIRGYLNKGSPVKAIALHRRMVDSGILPNQFTLPFVLKASASCSEYWVSVVVHGEAVKLGLGSHVCVQNALINCYVVFGSVPCARQLFDGISERTLVSWNSIIGGYSRTGCSKEAFLLFNEMREWGEEPDNITLVHLLSACSQASDLRSGRYMHFYIETTGIKIDSITRNALLDMYANCGRLHYAQRIFDRVPEKDVVSWTTLLGAYAMHGDMESVRRIFNRIPKKNVVSWNSMISCHAQNGHCKEAVDLFKKMCGSRIMLDETTLVSVLSACSQIGDLAIGEEIHDYVNNNFIMPSVTLFNSVINMYAKCGALKTAMVIFSAMPEKNLVSWNVIIGALALHGHGVEAIRMFEEMLGAGFTPNHFTFTGLLSACSHSGLVDLGQHYFTKINSFGIPYELEHYACMVDLFGRGGRLGEAVRVICGMPMKPDLVVWGALLGACRMHGNVQLAKQVLKQILELEPHSSGLYVLLSNLYSEAQRWEDMKNMRKLMTERNIVKCKAISFIEIKGLVHEFMVGDKKHGSSDDIYSMLDQLTDHMKTLWHLCNELVVELDGM